MVNWIHKQRTAYKVEQLSDERVDKLNSVRFIWDDLEYKWEQAYAGLVNYKKQYGHSNVTQDCLVDGVSLGLWVSNQRANYKNNKLSEIQIEKLNSINFVWNSLDEMWNSCYICLVEYKKQNGHCRVPRSYEVAGISLGQWTVTQRTNFKNNKLSAKRIVNLEALGFQWEPGNAFNDHRWEQNFDALVKYKTIYNSVNVDRNAVVDKINLGNWVATQRQLYREGNMSQYRTEKLNGIGFKWEADYEYLWDEKYNIMLELNRKNIVSSINKDSIIDGVKIGSWISEQRKAYKQGKLSQERIDKLNAIGIQWKIRRPRKPKSTNAAS
jgi:hypothetical protein